jgi:hypothetical protein
MPGFTPWYPQERQDRQLCELAAGLSALSAARQAERRNWAAQLEALEGGLEGARAEVEQHRWAASHTATAGGAAAKTCHTLSTWVCQLYAEGPSTAVLLMRP